MDFVSSESFESADNRKDITRQTGDGIRMTIRDVAEKSGVSVSTVSRVLNNHPDVSESVRAKVLEAVRELHYVPNDSARDLVRTQSDSIGVIVRGAENPFFTSLIRSIEQEVAKTGYTMVLHQIKSGEDELLAGAMLSRTKRLRGLIFLGGRFDYSEEQTAKLDVPFVCCTFTNSFGNLGQDDYSSVSIDDQAEAYRAVKMLTDKGHRKIAVLLDSVNDHSISELRYLGYRKALADAGIDFDGSLVAETTEYNMKSAYEATQALLQRRRDVTAIFSTADSMGIAAMKALHDAGRRVPEDCSLISIDGIEMSLYTVPTMTTLIQPTEIMGAQAVQALIDVIRGTGRHCHLRLDTEVREGGTIAEAS